MFVSGTVWGGNFAPGSTVEASLRKFTTFPTVDALFQACAYLHTWPDGMGSGMGVRRRVSAA
jgi:hypothetical protein